MIRRRYASYTKRGFPVLAISPGIVAEQRPTFRTVSIIPGIDLRAPERTETSSGFLASPNLVPMTDSTRPSARCTSAASAFGYERLFW